MQDGNPEADPVHVAGAGSEDEVVEEGALEDAFPNEDAAVEEDLAPERSDRRSSSMLG